MSLIQCACNCLYQKDGYCKLEKAAEITDIHNEAGCLHFRPREFPVPEPGSEAVPPTFTCQKEGSDRDIPNQ